MTLKAMQFGDDHDRIEWNLTNHTPNDEQIASIEQVRVAIKDAGHAIVAFCPNGRERSLALTALEELTFWSVAAIARAEGPY